MRRCCGVRVLVGLAAILIVLTSFLSSWRPTGAAEALFVLFAWLDQALMIALPAFIVVALTSYLERGGNRGAWFRYAVCVLFAFVATLVATVLFADVKIHALYGFHINGFVLNLVSTPGGIGSLEASRATWATVGILVATIFVGILGWLLRATGRVTEDGSTRRRPVWTIGWIVFSILLIDKGIYGYADLTGNGVVLRASGLFPFYQPVTFRSAARRIGIEGAPTLIRSVTQRGRLAYPKRPLAYDPLGGAPPNVLWLVAESMRFDLLTPTTMPRLWAFASQNLRFTHHYSGGNRTRIGMFTMFYSLHGPYWSHVLEERRGPVFFDVLDELGYDIEVFTSAKFSYPEFDRTIFVAVPPQRRHEYSEDEVFWHRDVHNVDAIIESLQGRDTKRPFMRFLFFESTHAPYQFPDADAIATPYGSVANYALMDPTRDIALMWNRYVNAAHFVDSQIGRLIDYLDSAGLLTNTIVVVSGDHGEEFLEHGHWGHGSAFIDEQMRVPLVMRIPGQGARVIDTVTSHLDIVPSILPALGVTNPTSRLRTRRRCRARHTGSRSHHRQRMVGLRLHRPASHCDHSAVRRFRCRCTAARRCVAVPALTFLQSHSDQLARVMAEMSAFLASDDPLPH